jgi:hypothetical protein
MTTRFKPGDGQVYVVSSVNHGEQEGVVAVFDDQDLAEHFAQHARKPSGSIYYVTVWRLNVPGGAL